jgi:transcriptional regulator with XRE-family HTH domain
MTGELLRRLREAAGIKQTDLARAANMANSTLSTYESGRNGMTNFMAARLVGLIDALLSDRTEEFSALRAEADAQMDADEAV